jgi:hypothetical protein
MNMSRRGRHVIFGAVVIGVLIVCWLVAVDLSAYVEVCRLCGSRRIAVETRLLGSPISQRFHSEKESWTARIAMDLGVPCQHSFDRGLVARRRGLLLPTTNECVPLSLLPVTAPEWYLKNVTLLTARLTAENPALPEEFRKKVLLQSDDVYLGRLLEKMWRLCPKASRDTTQGLPGTRSDIDKIGK